MHPPRIRNGIVSQLASLSLRPRTRQPNHLLPLRRTFTTTPLRHSWLIPKAGKKWKERKGRPRVRTGASTAGTTVVWGDYGLRMTDKGRRISAAHLKIGEDTIRKRLRGMKFRLYMRIVANVGVYTSGNDQRMGKGKGSFDYWASRVAVSRILFELSGDVHEQVVRDAFRLAGNKLPGMYEFVKKGDAPVMGITKLGNGVTAADLLRPRKQPASIEEMPTTTLTPTLSHQPVSPVTSAAPL
ncbi:mitochondrial large ribosomal subunit protein L16 [Tothia fuscella]|uniref:Mitochondrial large ribosomal subunit protein L16 n=1 Tax=Tothia fuscella TaxID=1048955 RepID=A0A9P4NIW3_9PEZI|nr:mitochondrial large ribosomal subunit protein L16 [Tothia fuscella]